MGTYLLVVVEHRVHVLDPDGVHGAIEQDPLAVLRFAHLCNIEGTIRAKFARGSIGRSRASFTVDGCCKSEAPGSVSSQVALT